MGKAQDDYDAARLLLVMVNEDLEFLRQALQDAPDDHRLAKIIQETERMRVAYAGLVAECLLRLQRSKD